MFFAFLFYFDVSIEQFVKIYNSLEREQLWAKAKFVYKFIERWKDLKYIIKAKIVFKRYVHLIYEPLLNDRKWFIDALPEKIY